MGKSKRVVRAKPHLTHANINKVLRIFIQKSSNPVPKLGEAQKAYISECSCFIISSLAIMYPDFAATISPVRLEQLLSKFLHYTCGKQSMSRGKQSRGKQSMSRRSRMKGGTLSIRASTKVAGKYAIFPGIFLFVYALLLTRSSVEQLNSQNPFRTGRYEFLNRARHELEKEELWKETMMVQITQDNLMTWVTQPNTQLAELTNKLSLKAIRIVGVLTQKHTEGLEQQVRDHCLGESIRHHEPVKPVEIPVEVPLEEESRWSSFKSRSWSTLSGFASSADNVAVRIAKAHLNANALFDMPGCVATVNELKFKEVMDQLKNEHARIKLDIDMWMKKGKGDINSIFGLFSAAISMILTSLGYAFYPETNTVKGQSYNMSNPNANVNAIAIENSEQEQIQEKIRPHLQGLHPLGRSHLPIESSAFANKQEQPDIQGPPIETSAFANKQEQNQPQGPPLETSAFVNHSYRDIQQRAIEDAQRLLSQVVHPSTRRVQQERMDKHKQIQRATVDAARYQEVASQEARRRQEDFADIKRRTEELAQQYRMGRIR